MALFPGVQAIPKHPFGPKGTGKLKGGFDPNRGKSSEGRGEGLSGFLGGYLQGSWGTYGGSFRNLVDKYTPTFSNVVQVKVHGGPRASMNDLYGLALSACFGATQNLNYASEKQISVEIDRTNKVVKVVLAYESCGLYSFSNFVGNLGGLYQTGINVIQNGISDEVKGANWPSWLSLGDRKNLKLPMIGQTIAAHNSFAIKSTTGTTEQQRKNMLNYAPFSDGVARDSDLTLVVAAALMNSPCIGPVDTKLIIGDPIIPQPDSPTTKFFAVPSQGSQLVDAARAAVNPGIAGQTVYQAGGVDTLRWAELARQAFTARSSGILVAQNYGTTQTQNPPNQNQ